MFEQIFSENRFTFQTSKDRQVNKQRVIVGISGASGAGMGQPL